MVQSSEGGGPSERRCRTSVEQIPGPKGLTDGSGAPSKLEPSLLSRAGGSIRHCALPRTGAQALTSHRALRNGGGADEEQQDGQEEYGESRSHVGWRILMRTRKA